MKKTDNYIDRTLSIEGGSITPLGDSMHLDNMFSNIFDAKTEESDIYISWHNDFIRRIAHINGLNNAISVNQIVDSSYSNGEQIIRSSIQILVKYFTAYADKLNSVYYRYNKERKKIELRIFLKTEAFVTEIKNQFYHAIDLFETENNTEVSFMILSEKSYESFYNDNIDKKFGYEKYSNTTFHVAS